MVRLTDRPDMTLDVYRGRKTTKQVKQPHKLSQFQLSAVYSAIIISFELAVVSFEPFLLVHFPVQF